MSAYREGGMPAQGRGFTERDIEAPGAQASKVTQLASSLLDGAGRMSYTTMQLQRRPSAAR